VCSCVKCNTRKANRLPHEAGLRLIRKPVRRSGAPSSRSSSATRTARSGRISSISPIGTWSSRSDQKAHAGLVVAVLLVEAAVIVALPAKIPRAARRVTAGINVVAAVALWTFGRQNLK